MKTQIIRGIFFASAMQTWGKIFSLALILAASISCQKNVNISSNATTDVVLIGGGIMSATLGSILGELDPNLSIQVFERLGGVALESSGAWNNAGTGHAAFAELNYTPQAPDGSISIKKAIEVGEAFEISKQYWSHLAAKKIIAPKSFINHVPHISFVWGDDNIAFLKKRFDLLIRHPLFAGMEYSEDHAEIMQWVPLIMQGRDASQRVAATRMKGGVDVNFGELARAMFDGLSATNKFKLNLEHEVQDLKRNDDRSWTVQVRDIKNNVSRSVTTRFVFIGAGGGALKLLQKSQIDEADGFGGFPVGGAWLISDREDLISAHDAKVYGKASVGSPPMSVPHLDTRFIDGKKALLFGPFATFSTKFQKSGSFSDLFLSISSTNMMPMLQVGFNNFDLVRYLVGQVMQSKEDQIAALREYMPNARAADWRFELAGQRVQVIKKDQDENGILQFGTELVSSHDASVVALLGASPGASTAVKTMLEVLNMSFKSKMHSLAWQEKLREMIPSYGKKLADDSEMITSVREKNKQLLELDY